MVDVPLPFETRDRPLGYLFLDLNAYFASVEQQEQPELRGRPVAVAAVDAETTFAIAASYEAKKFGVKCGVLIRDARAMCPGLVVATARPPLYVHYHRKVIAATETVLPIDKVCSIDEMRFKLIGEERLPENARTLAHRMKRAIAERVGESMTCSIGIAPNAFLAKVGTDMQKPDGLVVIEHSDLPHKLYPCGLTDFAGINRRTEIRLNANGIFTSEQLCTASKQELRHAFGSIIGERWWYLLRGFDVDFEAETGKSLGHSHVLPPALRTDQGCRDVLLRLLQKASARLRATNLWTSEMSVSVNAFKKSWHCRIKLPATQDSLTMTEYFLKEWPSRDFVLPRSVSVTFTHLDKAEAVTPSLFDPVVDRSKFSHAVDAVNQKFGKNSVFLAGVDRVKSSADEKIAFNKTWLFAEGKGDGEWVDTFRGATE